MPAADVAAAGDHSAELVDRAGGGENLHAGAVRVVVGAAEHRVTAAGDGIELTEGPHAVVAAGHDLERNPPFSLAHP